MKKHKKMKIIISALVILLVSTGILLYFYVQDSMDYQKNLIPVNRTTHNSSQKSKSSNNSNVSTSPQSVKDDEPVFEDPNTVNILFLGIDRTEERDTSIGIYRSDTIVLARFNLVTKQVKVLSVPRDTYTYVPIEKKYDKINHAYAFGSLKNKAVESTIDAVETFVKYGTVDYFFTLEMEPVPAIVDSIGGVMINVDVDMKTHGANLSKGLQLLNGNMAFDYIHWRYSGNGDIDRIKRQQKFAGAVFKKLKQEGRYLEALDIVMSYKKNIKTDLSAKQLIGLAKLASEVPSGGITYFNVEGEGKMINKISYWAPDLKKKDKMLREFFYDAKIQKDRK